MSSVGQLMVFGNAMPGREVEFNAWYNDVHIPEIRKLAPEISAVNRFALNTLLVTEGQKGWQYLTVYEVAADKLPEVLARMNAAMANGEFQMTDTADELSRTMVYANPL